MFNPEISKYLKEGLERGFDLTLLKTNLSSAGFNYKDISDSMPELTIQQIKKEVPLEKKSFFSAKNFLIFGIIIIVLIAIFIGYLIYNPAVSQTSFSPAFPSTSSDFKVNCLSDGLRVFYLGKPFESKDLTLFTLDGLKLKISYAEKYVSTGQLILATDQKLVSGEHIIKIGSSKNSFEIPFSC